MRIFLLLSGILAGIIILSLILIFFIPTLSGYATSSAEDNNDFTTYVNEDYGFSIDYSPNWIAKEDHLQPGQIVIFHPDPEEFETLPFAATVSIWTTPWPTSKNMSIEEVNREYGTNENMPGIRLVSKNITTLSGLPAADNTYYNYNDNQNLKAREVFAVMGNEIFFVFYNTHPGYYDEYLPMVNQMVESFMRLTEK